MKEHLLESLHHLRIIKHLLRLEFGARTKIRQNPAGLLSNHWLLMMQVLLKEIHNPCTNQRIVLSIQFQTNATNDSYAT